MDTARAAREALRFQDDVTLSYRCESKLRYSGSEYRHDRRPDGHGKMHRGAVIANKRAASPDQLRGLRMESCPAATTTLGTLSGERNGVRRRESSSPPTTITLNPFPTS